MSDMRTLRAEPPLTLEESEAEADRILSEAGWTTTLKPPWRGRHVAPGLVGGRAPDGNAYAKAYTAFSQAEAVAMGLDPALYPDQPHEAAAVLVASVLKPEQDTAHVESDPDNASDGSEGDEEPQAAAPGEPDEEALDETHGETGEEADGAEGAHGAAADADEYSEGAQDPGSAATDADYEAIRDNRELDLVPELPEIELIPPDPDPSFGSELLDWEGELAAEPEDDQAARDAAFIFGDNLDQKRTAAIGLVVQIALQKMPAITVADDARLAELRNFTLGVSEGRWANDPGKQAELEGLELIASLARQVEAARDAKVALLVSATREQIEAFDPLSDWP